MLRINSDVGEGFDAVDAALIPLIDQASVACGGHAGNEATMRKCLKLAKKHGTTVGAHPSYPDRENFGRHSLSISNIQLVSSLKYQINTFLNYSQQEGVMLSYVKPHGALYNDMVNKPEVFNLVCSTIEKANKLLTNPLMLMVPGCMINHSALERINLHFIFEGFADRAYQDDGGLVSRKKAHAVHKNLAKITTQVTDFIEKKGVYSENNIWLPMAVDTLCVHGDTPDALPVVKAVRECLNTLQ